ncbi:hypothetical protein AAVH_23579 [Aphelenchoides avenae]|nr:hypothetical protein AAVH_23579 [Aphelenchus avenae]
MALQRFCGDASKRFHLTCETNNVLKLVDVTVDSLCNVTNDYVDIRDHLTQLILRIEHGQPGSRTFLARPRLPLRLRQRQLLDYLPADYARHSWPSEGPDAALYEAAYRAIEHSDTEDAD